MLLTLPFVAFQDAVVLLQVVQAKARQVKLAGLLLRLAQALLAELVALAELALVFLYH